ncbi:transcriptional regulator, XRE family [Desulfofarcimen acetoxidans DSM 771]|uniref:Transcriptional regulator, XRE family n=1 Tax=Desulfofarcimen acetoxidans (strain ATCC 49208 / DSM 771 / KCTC 5769 / VKM B-1644 / 5575) TaxID=485916 RepID=C8W0I3_DESAS|nr:helix-turn-helix transcriptional regulator [Desulfofarcimen acetoxidans]ACV63238.1 transcriptional regulator, XRE family [Desulfofarcimen acetoxidans DSM 771]
MKRLVLLSEIQQRNLTYTEVGKAVDVSRQMVSYIINCQCNPSWKLQRRLENFFGIPASELLAESEELPQPIPKAINER